MELELRKLEIQKTNLLFLFKMGILGLEVARRVLPQEGAYVIRGQLPQLRANPSNVLTKSPYYVLLPSHILDRMISVEIWKVFRIIRSCTEELREVI